MHSDPIPRKVGSLTMTVRPGDELRIVTPSGDEVTVYVAALSATRASLNIRAPIDHVIQRVKDNAE